MTVIPRRQRTLLAATTSSVWGNVMVPIGYLPQEMLNAQNQPVICVDTMFSQTMHLRSDRTVAFVSDVRRYCDGSAPVALDDEPLGGTYTIRGDSVTLRLQANAPTGPISFSWEGELRSSTLTFRFPIYTETDQDGSSGNTYDFVYRRR